MPAELPTAPGHPPWLAAAQAGDAAAFAELVQAHQSALRRQLRQLTQGDVALADDLAQDSLIQAWQALPQFRGEARLSTWLHRIAYRCFLMRRRQDRNEAGATGIAAGSAAGGWSGVGSGAAREAAVPAGHALRIDLQRALAALPTAQREAIVHCYHLDLTHEEAADVLGWPLGTLKSHVARAKAALRLSLAAWHNEETE